MRAIAACLALLLPAAAVADVADATEPIEIGKLSVKKLNRMLKQRGARCHGCTDKSEYATRLAEV